MTEPTPATTATPESADTADTASIANAVDPNAPTLALLDGHALFHRSFHAFPEEMSTAAGEPTNAVYGFTRMLLDILRYVRPDYLIVTFDRPTPTFRHKNYAPYKAHRPLLPDSMRAQFPRVREVVSAFSIPIYEIDGFEADDVLGTLARQAEAQRTKVTIATGDLDTLQLVDDWVRVTFARNPQRGNFDYFDVAAMEARYGFAPPRLVDYKSLVGDKSDNIPGVPGVGEKTATKLIQDYGTLENILAHVDALAPRVRAALTEHEEQARQSKYLATIVTDVPLTLDLEGARALRYDPDRVLRLFRELEFSSLVDRLPRRAADAGTASATFTPAPSAPRLAIVVTPSAIGAADDPTLIPAPIGPAQLSLFDESALQALAEEGDTALIAGPMMLTMPRPQTVLTMPTTGTSTLVIDTPEGLDVMARSLANAGIFAFDLETDSTNELHAKIVGLSFAVSEGEAFYVPVGHLADATGTEPGRQLPLAEVVERLRPVMSDPQVGKVGHNAKFDMMVLERHGIWTRGLRCDTMVGAYLLNPGRRGLGLKDQAFETLGVIMTPITDLIGTGKQQITMERTPIRAAADYAGADADITLRLMRAIEPKLAALNLDKLFHEVEVPLVPVLARMELTGILVDPEFLRKMGGELDEQIGALEKDVYEAVGHEFNLNSTKQLSEVLFTDLKLPHARKTKTGFSVDAETLDGLRGLHPAVDALLEYRQLSKLKSTYVDGLLEMIDPDDHRVHTSFNQTIASTGRLSSTNPNLQNIPVRAEVGRRIRRAFLADPGCYLLTADYSQIELRILAHITHEPALVEAFEKDEDVHAATAARLFNVPLDEVQPDQRRLAKTVNFAVLYGQSPFGLARVTGMGNSAAVEFIRNYEVTFPLVREYTQRTLYQARTQGYVQTLLGRRRYLPDPATQPVALRQASEREAINMPIQGTNADMIKIAMIRLQDQLEDLKLGARQILQ
ncbi:MAG TPA: DNA polymerase I, partial [Ktedonobacterales bacterium]|nr:DNA polymerase I [Ktedonobacterales bacterium]